MTVVRPLLSAHRAGPVSGADAGADRLHWVVGQRHQHPGQSDAVGDAVVHPHDDGTAAAVEPETKQPRLA